MICENDLIVCERVTHRQVIEEGRIYTYSILGQCYSHRAICVGARRGRQMWVALRGDNDTHEHIVHPCRIFGQVRYIVRQGQAMPVGVRMQVRTGKYTKMWFAMKYMWIQLSERLGVRRIAQ